MSIRTHEEEDMVGTVAVQRVTLTVIAGTLDHTESWSNVTGMTALPCVVQHMTAAQVQRVIGKVETGAYSFILDNDHMPSGGVIKVNDHVVVASGIYQGTYEVIDARLIQGREWNCVMVLKPESKTA